MKSKRESFGYCLTWLMRNYRYMEKYASTFYHQEDKNRIIRFLLNNPIQAKKIIEDSIKRNNQKLQEVIKAFAYGKSKIVYIIGARDSGKTATTFKIAEEVYNLTHKRIYYIGQGINKDVLPSWCKHLNDVRDAPHGSFGIIDEAAIQYNARDFQSEENKDLGKLLAIARHKDMFLIFITQHSSLADVNITRLRDMMIWKMSNDYSIQERGTKNSKEHQFWMKAKLLMQPSEKPECLFEYPAHRRLIHFSHNLPLCWNDGLSKIWGNKDFKKEEELEVIRPIAKRIIKI